MLLVRPLQVLPSVMVSMCGIEMSQLWLPDHGGAYKRLEPKFCMNPPFGELEVIETEELAETDPDEPEEAKKWINLTRMNLLLRSLK